MPIVFEPSREFGRLPEYHQQVVEERLLGEEFDSLEAALNSEYKEGCSFSELEFRRGSVTVRPEELPTIVNELPILWHQTDDSHVTYSGVYALTAKVVD